MNEKKRCEEFTFLKRCGLVCYKSDVKNWFKKDDKKTRFSLLFQAIFGSKEQNVKFKTTVSGSNSGLVSIPYEAIKVCFEGNVNLQLVGNLSAFVADITRRITKDDGHFKI